jgi:hypothetical protein
MSTTPGAAAAIVFFLIAALHGYWALGGVWPGRDAESLARTVVGGPPGMAFPGRAATWAVVAVLLTGAMTALAAGGLIVTSLPMRVVRSLALVGAAVLLVRGVEGFFDVRLRPETAGSPFVRLNVVLYSPLCLVLAVLFAAAALG